MRTLTTISLLIFLASCVSIPYKPIKQYKHFAGTCAIRCFDYNKLQITNDRNCGENFRTNLRLPASFCDGVVGPDINDYAADIKPRVIENIQYCNDK